MLLLLGALFCGSVLGAPCDIYSSSNTPCVAAHSTIRSLLNNFTGALYQVTRASDQTTLDITPSSTGGIANSSAQEWFCQGTSCIISIIYDQSGQGNHLTAAPAGGANNHPETGAKADALPIIIGTTANPTTVYGVFVESGIGYRNDATTGIPTGDTAESIYMVADGTIYNSGCCFDYGNAETNNLDDGAGTMEAIYFGNNTGWGTGAGAGPWVMADLEDGLFACGDRSCPNVSPVQTQYVVAMLKGRPGGTFALKQGDAVSGNLITTYDGPRPKGYSVMKKQGAIILGIGGDNSNWATGAFFEGVIVNGVPDDSVDNQIQADIQTVGYGISTGQKKSYSMSDL